MTFLDYKLHGPEDLVPLIEELEARRPSTEKKRSAFNGTFTKEIDTETLKAVLQDPDDAIL